VELRTPDAAIRFEEKVPEGRAVFEGAWRLSDALPPLADIERLIATTPVRRLEIVGSAITAWDSRLVAILARLEGLALRRGLEVHLRGFPHGVERLLAMAARGGTVRPPSRPRPGPLAHLGLLALRARQETLAALAFLGELAFALLRLVRGRADLELRDVLLFLQRCGSDALPIVSLISLLVGVILAFVGAMQLGRFGAEIYVANLVTLGMAREMGALMAAIIMAGRTGAAFAAELGTMQTNEEIDALRTLGISPVDYLVLPRLLALALMMPLLALYADAVGMLGGALSAVGLFDLTLLQYYEQSLQFIDFGDFGAGLGKAALFGWLVAFAGCYRGMHATRSAAGVGEAATSAVVLSIVLIVLGDALMTVIYYVLDI